MLPSQTHLRLICAVSILIGLGLGPLSAAALASDAPKSRYISAHAYYQALRAELLSLRGDRESAREGFRLGLVYDPESYSLTARLARTALDQGRSSAGMLAERAVELAPNDPEALLLMGDVERSRGKPGRAERMYRRAVRFGPTSAAGRRSALAYADLLLDRGQDRLAIRFLRRISQRNFDHPLLAQRLALIELAQGDRSSAKKRLDRASASASEAYWPLLGRAYAAVGEHAKASSCFFEAYALSASDLSDDVLREAAAHELAFGEPDRAAKYLSAIKRPVVRARAREDLDPDGAMAVLSGIKGDGVECSDATEVLADLQAARGNYRRGIETLEASATTRSHPWLSTKITHLLIMAGDFEAAEAKLAEGGLDDDGVDGDVLRAELLFAQGRTQEAWTRIEHARSVDAGNQYAQRLFVEMAVASRTHLTEAHRLARRRFLDRPDRAERLSSLGEVLLALRKTDQARFFLSEAERRAPKNPTIAERFGDALFESGRTGAAKKRYESALTMWKQSQPDKSAREAVDRLEAKVRKAS